MTPWLDGFDAQSRMILQALLNTLWPGMLLVGVTWFGLRMVGRTSASSRSAIWLVNLLFLFALPWLPTGSARLSLPTSSIAPPLGRLSSALAHPAAPVVPVSAAAVSPEARAISTASIDSAQRRFTPAAIAPPAVDQLTEMPAGGVGAPGSSANPSTESPSLLGRWSGALFGGIAPILIVGLWAAVAGAMLGRIGWSFIHLFVLRRRLGLLPASSRVRGQEMAEIYGIRRRVRFFTSSLVGGPVTIGWLRPLVILPPDLVDRLSVAELDSILAHELAHIKRWDYLINLLQRIAQAVFFFHPAVWITGRQLSIERELACDDWALKMTGEPRRYATCLTKMIETLGPARPLALATGIIFGKHVISRRIEMILNRNRNAATSVSKPALLSAFGAAGLAVAMCATFAPVIAVPLAQAPVVRPAAEPAAPRAPIAPAAPTAAPLPPTVVALAIGPADLPEPPEAPEAPEAPVAPDPFDAPLIEYLEDPAPVSIAPRAPMPARAVSYQDLFVTAPVQTPPGFATRRSEPMIPEAELLSLLTDIVKKDSDPNVRTEALRGIYRIRTEAGVNALLGLYDSIPDAKTKGEILEYLMRREGDNSRAVAKLLQIAKTEKDETLRNRALRQLSKVPGDDGAGHLIGIYDSLQEPKEKQLLIRYLGMNKSRKAVDKLIQIAKNDSDPNVRQTAIRSLYAIDNNLYLDVRKGVSSLTTAPLNATMLELNEKMRAIELDQLHKFENFQFEWKEEDRQRWIEDWQKNREELQRELEAHREALRAFPRPEIKVRPELKPKQPAQSEIR
ncbi:MAG: HEAT repeat domain-containing protein [Acidobacteria bacterium]|nr:HEAT repeat domain-containing protein [Acidobacteriota bacterium]MCW5970483.1 HEAT repeat domain-containing protein [Blastocatellales bacterium]